MKRLVKNLRRLHRGKKGFTLLEVMVVVAILAVLVALVLPNFGGLISQAKTVTVQGQLEKAKEACLAFNTDTGTWPREYSDSSSTSNRQLTQNQPGLTGWNGPYLERPFLANKWGGATRVMYDDPTTISVNYLNHYDFTIGGTATPGKDCFLYLTEVPMSVCDKLDYDIDGTDHDYSHGVVIYHDHDGDGDCNLGILIAD